MGPELIIKDPKKFDETLHKLLDVASHLKNVSEYVEGEIKSLLEIKQEFTRGVKSDG